MSLYNINVFGSNQINIPKSLLNTLSLSHTSSGVLCKWNSIIDGDTYYFKSGNLNAFGMFTDRQPQAELMVYRIGLQLGIKNLVETKVSVINFPDNGVYEEQEALVSYTKDFLPSSLYSYVGIHKYFDDYDLRKNISNLYNLFINKFPFIEQDLINMLLFDFIILNIDRHLNNFGLIEKEGVPIGLNPIFDNGLSLLANLSDDDLLNISDFYLDKKMKVKPFKSNPYSQLNIVDFSKVPSDLKESILNCNLDWTKVFEGLDLKDSRKNRIKSLVEGRLNHVKSLLLKMV